MALIQLIDSATATGAGAIYPLAPNEQSGVYTLHLVVEADTSISDFVCTLEGGLINDATYFCTLDQVDYTNDLNASGNAAMMHFEKEPVAFVRGNLTTLTGTGTVSVYLLVSPNF